jgi:hypothetical protein
MGVLSFKASSRRLATPWTIILITWKRHVPTFPSPTRNARYASGHLIVQCIWRMIWLNTAFLSRHVVINQLQCTLLYLAQSNNHRNTVD